MRWTKMFYMIQALLKNADECEIDFDNNYSCKIEKGLNNRGYIFKIYASNSPGKDFTRIYMVYDDYNDAILNIQIRYSSHIKSVDYYECKLPFKPYGEITLLLPVLYKDDKIVYPTDSNIYFNYIFRLFGRELYNNSIKLIGADQNSSKFNDLWNEFNINMRMYLDTTTIDEYRINIFQGR